MGYGLLYQGKQPPCFPNGTKEFKFAQLHLSVNPWCSVVFCRLQL